MSRATRSARLGGASGASFSAWESIHPARGINPPPIPLPEVAANLEPEDEKRRLRRIGRFGLRRLAARRVQLELLGQRPRHLQRIEEELLRDHVRHVVLDERQGAVQVGGVERFAEQAADQRDQQRPGDDQDGHLGCSAAGRAEAEGVLGQGLGDGRRPPRHDGPASSRGAKGASAAQARPARMQTSFAHAARDAPRAAGNGAGCGNRRVQGH